MHPWLNNVLTNIERIPAEEKVMAVKVNWCWKSMMILPEEKNLP